MGEFEPTNPPLATPLSSALGCKNANPKPAGLRTAQTRVSGLAKCPGFPWVFENPGFNPY